MEATLKSRLSAMEWIILDSDRVMRVNNVGNLCHKVAFARKVKANRIANKIVDRLFKIGAKLY